MYYYIKRPLYIDCLAVRTLVCTWCTHCHLEIKVYIRLECALITRWQHSSHDIKMTDLDFKLLICSHRTNQQLDYVGQSLRVYRPDPYTVCMFYNG